MKLKLAAILLLAVGGCATAEPVLPEPLKAGDTIYAVLPEPLRVGHNIYLLLRDKGRPYLEWVDGVKIAEDFCLQRQEGKAEIKLVTEPDHTAFACELAPPEKRGGPVREVPLLRRSVLLLGPATTIALARRRVQD